MAQDYLDRLSEFVVDFRLEDTDDATRRAARDVVLDTLGAIIAGSRLPENAALAGLAARMSGPGNASIIGHRQSGDCRDGDCQPGHSPNNQPLRAQPVWAALVNATAGVALEMDEGNRLGGGHPAIHTAPAALAVGEDLGCRGRAALESVIVGYEVTARIGAATEVRPEVHSHGTWGTIGAAAATARLLGFDAAQTRLAMSLAVSMSPANTWTPCIEGATVRNLYPGRSGFQGIMAAHLSGCGFTGLADAPSDMYGKLLGAGFDRAAAVAGLGDAGVPLRIARNYFKFHACCLYNHPALDAAQDLRRQASFAASEVAEVTVTAPPIAQIMDDPAPGNMLAAKFSIPYAVALALSGGDTGVAGFLPERVADAGIRRLAQRVRVRADARMDLRRYDYPAARVAVRLRDGRVLEASVSGQRGDFTNPASRAELTGKFAALAAETLGAERTAQVIATAGRLEELDDIGELTALLCGPGGPK